MSDVCRSGLRRRAEDAHDRLTAAVCEYAAWMAARDGPERDEVMGPARVLVALGQQLKIAAVLRARAHGATWSQVGEALGVGEETARRLYGEAERRWLAGDPAPWAPEPAARNVIPLARRGGPGRGQSS